MKNIQKKCKYPKVVFFKNALGRPDIKIIEREKKDDKKQK